MTRTTMGRGAFHARRGELVAGLAVLFVLAGAIVMRGGRPAATIASPVTLEAAAHAEPADAATAEIPGTEAPSEAVMGSSQPIADETGQ